MRDGALSRRVFLTRAFGQVLTLGVAPILGLRSCAERRAFAARDPYAGGVWLSGDHHIHTQYSIDGLYGIEEQVRSAKAGGLDFCVITDHGGPGHDRVLLERAYPQLVEARRRHPEITVFQGLEWNIPDAEHGSVIMPPSPDEAQLIAEFESRFDQVATAKREHPARTEADAIAGVRYLQQKAPKALFIANHPARRGLDSPHELRAWSDAGPDVTRGFEGAPGHGAATLAGIARGYYGQNPGNKAYPGYPLHSYRTWGGYDYYTAQVGGLWDALLGEGRPFYITANSDAHRYRGDLQFVDRSTYHTHGHVTADPSRTMPPDKHNPDEDYLPGAYARTYVHAAARDPLAILSGMRGGNMWTVQGGLIEGFELLAHDDKHAAPMGSALVTSRGADVEIVVRVKPARHKNLGGAVPVLHHIDLISGRIREKPDEDRDNQLNLSAQVLAQLVPAAGQRRGPRGEWLEFRRRFPRVEESFYVRVRGTNLDAVGPRLDPLGIDPFSDLWFYSNPIMVRVF